MATETMSDEQPHAGHESYSRIGERYLATVDERPFNALYDRPAMMALVPDVGGADVLDAGCGSGWYAEQLAARGAHVTAIDVMPEFVGHTQRRLGERGAARVADLGGPLDFAMDSSFDLVLSALTLHYLEHWEPTLRELARVLRPGGVLLFSTHHPTVDFQRLGRNSYFDTELVDDDWGDLGHVRFYRRSLTSIVEAVRGAGFAIDTIVEPRPVESMRDVAPDAYARLMRFPGFIIVRACREE